MTDVRRIRERMERMELSAEKIAPMMDISPTGLRYKLRTDTCEWTVVQAVRLQRILKLNDREFREIFLEGVL